MAELTQLHTAANDDMLTEQTLAVILHPKRRTS